MLQEYSVDTRLGYQKKKRRLLGKEVFPNEYGPARSYYNVRNGILLHRLYPEALNLKSHLRYHFYKRVGFYHTVMSGRSSVSCGHCCVAIAMG